MSNPSTPELGRPTTVDQSRSVDAAEAGSQTLTLSRIGNWIKKGLLLVIPTAFVAATPGCKTDIQKCYKNGDKDLAAIEKAKKNYKVWRQNCEQGTLNSKVMENACRAAEGFKRQVKDTTCAAESEIVAGQNEAIQENQQDRYGACRKAHVKITTEQAQIFDMVSEDLCKPAKPKESGKAKK